MDFETFDRIDGLTLTKDAIALRDVLTRMSVNLFNEGFDKEDIIESRNIFETFLKLFLEIART